jgi:hypothetical protein
MRVKYFGDIPQEHIELLEELKTLEEWFDNNGGGLPPISQSKGMVCIGHDYHFMGMDEEGDRFLLLAEKYSPGYFRGPIRKHIDNDLEFAILVDQMKETPGFKTMESLGYREK